MGVEPTTVGLKGRLSTVELPIRVVSVYHRLKHCQVLFFEPAILAASLPILPFWQLI